MRRKGGYIAEERFAEIFNFDAILKGADARDVTDRYEGWSNLEWNGAQLKKNDNVLDIVITRIDEIIKTAQSKMVNGKTYNVRCSDRNIAGALARCLIGWVK